MARQAKGIRKVTTARQSKVILSGNNSGHKSRLIKAAQALDLKDFSEKPSGVWGSKATIKCNNVTLKSSELDVEFNIPFDDDLEANEGEILVYNLSDNTVKQLKTDETLTIEAGYEGDTGKMFEGKVRKVLTNREGADRITTIKVYDGITTSTEELIEAKKISDSYDGKSAKEILKALLEAEGSPIAKFEVSSDYEYEGSVSVGGDLQAEIKKHSETCGVSTFKSNGKIYSCALKDVSSDITFNVSEETGMIGSPSPFEETVSVEGEEKTIKGFDIEMLFQPRAAVGAIVNLKSEQYSGKYYIKSGKHRFNESEAITTIKVVEQ